MRWQTLDHSPPLIIAHRGASGLRPEHTLEAYELALAQGADVIEPDLVPSADGVLYARHDAELAGSTDIALREGLLRLQRNGDWRTDMLAAEDIDQLRARQPFPGRATEFDRCFAVPRWSAVLDWAARAAQQRGTPIILYPELKHPADFHARGIDSVRSFIDSVAKLPEGVQVWVQCFEPEPLRRVYEATGLPCCLLVDSGRDWAACLRDHGGWLARLGVNKALLPRGSESEPDLVQLAHQAGLRVDVWTLRDDRIGGGHATVQDELHAVLATGVDGVFCDFPSTGVIARAKMTALDTWHHIVKHRDLKALDALLANDVVFHSPVVHTPQRGKQVTAQYLYAAFHVFFNDSFRYVREVVGSHDAVLEFQVEIDGIEVNGVDMIHWNDDGRIVDFKVMLRPLKAINLIHAKMAQMLAARG